MPPRSAPTFTVSPGLAEISASTPADGAGTSTVTLSVSSSTRGSSAFTASPSCLNHCATVASVTDSPSCGTRISFAMSGPLFVAERLVEQASELFLVLAHEPGRGRRRSRPSGIAHPAMPRLDEIERPLDVRLHERPPPHIERLFLAPDHFRLLEP